MMTFEQSSTDPIEPWYKQFWPWVLIGLPGTVVVASIITLFIAINNADDIVSDEYYKEGLAINRTLAADEKAKALQVQAKLGVDFSTQQLSIDLQGQLLPAPKQLRVQFVHPVNADDDFTLFLTATAPARYAGRLPQPLQGRWTIEIADAEASAWRLRKEIAVPAAGNTPIHFNIAP